ncbi:MAG: hypothetical protein RL347_1359 [Actinomycetota bacterium]|jgi:hypothetical protein
MRSAIAVALAAPLLLAACSGETAAGESATSMKPQGWTGAPAESSAKSSAPAATPAPAPSKPSAAGMATDRLADAVLEQLKIDSADTFSDQLITIALSPLMRQLASTADITTRVESDGPRVTLTMKGADSTCVITVTDEPRARGVVCKQA